MSKKELIQESVQKAFDQFTDVNEVYTTNDGQVFISENYARMHARDKKLSVTTHSRPSNSTTAPAAAAEEKVSDYSRFKKADLVKLLEERGIAHNPTDTNKTLQELLEASDKEKNINTEE